MIGAGVPAGAQTPNQPERMKSIPASVKVGMFGKAFKRWRACDGDNLELLVPIVRQKGKWRRNIELNATSDQLL